MTREEARKAWIEALRSNKYPQGKRRLRSRKEGEELFCVLGVLMEVVKDHFGYSKYLEEGYRKGDAVYAALLPDEIVDFIGLNGAGGSHVENGVWRLSLSELNDGKGTRLPVSFSTFAEFLSSPKSGFWAENAGLE